VEGGQGHVPVMPEEVQGGEHRKGGGGSETGEKGTWEIRKGRAFAVLIPSSPPLLLQVEGFAQLDEDVLKKVGAAMTEVSFGRGQCIVKKNDTGKAFYIIMEGKVRISNIGHSGKR
jgi:hypothetical protein